MLQDMGGPMGKFCRGPKIPSYTTALSPPPPPPAIIDSWLRRWYRKTLKFYIAVGEF